MRKPPVSEQKSPCARDCPNRSPTCHNAQTCAIWAEHEKAKAERMAERSRRWQQKRMTWEDRATYKGP